MNTRLIDTLYDKYPLIVRDRPISGGITCGEGWYSIIDNLCARIQQHVTANDVQQVTAIQIKEKCGELRFYYRGGDEHVRSSVNAAKADSITVCEVCGAPGMLNPTPSAWWRTRCEKHVDTQTT